jgi:hypothetical protein
MQRDGKYWDIGIQFKENFKKYLIHSSAKTVCPNYFPIRVAPPHSLDTGPDSEWEIMRLWIRHLYFALGRKR